MKHETRKNGITQICQRAIDRSDSEIVRQENQTDFRMRKMSKSENTPGYEDGDDWPMSALYRSLHVTTKCCFLDHACNHRSHHNPKHERHERKLRDVNILLLWERHEPDQHPLK